MDTLLFSLQTWLTLPFYTVPQLPHSLKFQNLYVLKLSFSDHSFFEIVGQLSGITLQKVSSLGGTHQLPPDIMIGMDPKR